MKKLDVYLSNLAVGNVLLHNLHWNLNGVHFKQAHEYLEELYDEAFEYLDDVAELQKQLGYKPLSTMKDYLNTTSLKELELTEFKDTEAIEYAYNYIKSMHNLAKEIRSEADENDNFLVSNLMEDHITDYTKHEWFLSSMLK